MKPYNYPAHVLVGFLCAGFGGWAFGAWQGSTAAGWFMFFLLDAVGDIPIALRCIAYKPHPHEEDLVR